MFFFLLKLPLNFVLFTFNFERGTQVEWLVDVHRPLNYSHCLLRSQLHLFTNRSVTTPLPPSSPVTAPMFSDPIPLLSLMRDPLLSLLPLSPLLCLPKYLLAPRIHIWLLAHLCRLQLAQQLLPRYISPLQVLQALVIEGIDRFVQEG